MGSLSIRGLEDDLIRRLRLRAARHGRSAEAEVREMLREGLRDEGGPSLAELAAELRRLTAGRQHTPAELLQREGRDER
jgi:plasmid stability protein